MSRTLLYIAIIMVFYIMGAYATTDILRLVKGSTLSINAPHCYCPKCQSKIRLKDQIPIVSYILGGGKCRNCKSPIPIFDLFFELFIFVLLSAIAICLRFHWTAYLCCICAYELTKVIFIAIYKPRENAFVKNLLHSLMNNLVIFALLGFLFLLVEIS